MKKTPTLVEEIARLICVYPPKEWEALHKVLINDEIKYALINSAQLALSVAHKPRSNRALKQSNKIYDSDPEKNKILLEISRALKAKEICPTAASLRNLGDTAGLKDQLSVKRYKAIDQLINYFSNKDETEIRNLLKSTSPTERDFGAEYRNWVDHILGRQAGA